MLKDGNVAKDFGIARCACKFSIELFPTLTDRCSD
jgi:hypothetical protein